MPRERPSEAAEDQGHAPAFVTERERKVPRCVTCGRDQPGAPYLHTVCPDCTDARIAADEAAIQAHTGAAVPPFTRHQRERKGSGLTPVSVVLTAKAIEARKKLGIR